MAGPPQDIISVRGRDGQNLHSSFIFLIWRTGRDRYPGAFLFCADKTLTSLTRPMSRTVVLHQILPRRTKREYGFQF